MLTRPVIRASRLCCRCYATTPATAPPMLLKIRQALSIIGWPVQPLTKGLFSRRDMKTAMQNKDSNRLSVLRALLSQALNASKTNTPINTDMQVLALLRKSTTASRAACEEFRSAGRQDLVDKEESQLKIMEEYAGAVETVGNEEIRNAVKGVVDAMKSEGAKMQIGDVLKKIFAPEALGAKPVERGEVAKIVKQVLAEP